MMSVEKQSRINGKSVTRVCILDSDGSLLYPIIFHRVQQDVFDHPLFINKLNSPCIIFSKDRKNVKGCVVKEYAIIKAESSIKVLKSFFIDKVNIHANELLYSDLARKLYIDIDLSPTSEPESIQEFESISIESMVNSCIQTISKVVSKEFPENQNTINNVTPKKFISERDEKTIKKSAHIIFPGIVFKDLEENHMFIAILKYHITNESSDLLDDETKGLLSKCLDFKIYTKNRSFRLPFQSKMDKNNRLLPEEDIVVDDESLHEYLVGVYTTASKGSFSNYKLIENGKKMIGENCATKMGGTFLPLKKNKKQLSPKSTIDNGIQSLLKINYSILEDLVKYDTLPPVLTYEYTNKNKIEFYLSCIPNHDQGQNWFVWWAIGQSLKNIEADEYTKGNNSQPGSFYLDQWIKWTCKSEIYQKNAHIGCSSAWQQMKVRCSDSPQYKYKLLNSIAKIYYGDAFINCFDQGLHINELFSINGVDESVFDSVDKYNGDDKQNTTLNGYCKPYDFEKYRCIVSQAPMGSGKTHQIKECLKDHEKFKRILVLSPRQTFSKEKFAEFNTICQDFMHYQSEEVKEIYDWSSINKLVVQVESLVRFPDVENARCNLKYDLVILDEIESILYQFSSTTNRNVIKAFQVFTSILLSSKYIIMADAFITKRTISLCRYLKNHKYFCDRASPYFPIKMDDNLHNPNAEKQAIILSTANNPKSIVNTKGIFLKELYKDLKSGKKVCIVSSSRLFIDEILEAAKACGINKESVCVYDSLTDDTDIDALQNIRTIWKDPLIRLVIYTTKITVGINFDLKDIFHKIYIYGSVMCPNIRDLMQAHFRVRHTIDNQVMIAMNCFESNKYFEMGDATYEGSKTYNQEINEKSLQNKYVSGLSTLKSEMSTSQVEIYDQIVNYNKLEDVIGLTCYYELFYYLLKRIGYNVINNSDKNAQPKNDTKGTSKDETFGSSKFQLFPPSYVKDFILHRDLSDRDKLVSNKKSGCALKSDKIRLSCHYFYKTYLEKRLHAQNEDVEKVIIDILGSDKVKEIEANQSFESIMNEEITTQNQHITQMFLRRKKELQISFLEMLETEIYNRCCKDKNLERWIENIGAEIDARSKKCARKDIRHMVMEEREQQLRLKSIQEICNILGIDYSFDYGRILTDNRIMDFVDYLRKNPELEKLFHIRKTSAKLTRSRGLTILSGILSFWNGCFMARDSTQQRCGGKERETVLTGEIKISDCLFSNIYIRFNTLSFEKSKKQEQQRALEAESRSKNKTVLMIKNQIEKQKQPVKQ